METGNTYVYFALTGDNFDPQIVTERIGVTLCCALKTGQFDKVIKLIILHIKLMSQG